MFVLTQGPPIDGFIMSFALYDLWRQVLWRATQGPGPICKFFRETEVRYFQMSIPGKK